MPKPASLDLEVGVAWIRDTECGDEEEAYELFQDAMNASIAFAGCWLYFVCQWLLESESMALTIGLLFIVIVRMLAVRFDIRLQRDQMLN